MNFRSEITGIVIKLLIFAYVWEKAWIDCYETEKGFPYYEKANEILVRQYGEVHERVDGIWGIGLASDDPDALNPDLFLAPGNSIRIISSIEWISWAVEKDCVV